MKHSLQFKRKDTGEVFLITSEIEGKEKSLNVAVVDEKQDKAYRKLSIEVYQQYEK